MYRLKTPSVSVAKIVPSAKQTRSRRKRCENVAAKTTRHFSEHMYLAECTAMESCRYPVINSECCSRPNRIPCICYYITRCLPTRYRAKSVKI